MSKTTTSARTSKGRRPSSRPGVKPARTNANDRMDWQGLDALTDEEVIARAKRYYETNYGVTVVASESLAATDSYSIGKMDAGMAQAAFSRIDRPDIDALVVPGGNFPTMDWIAPWERQFGKPVITTNQAALWAVLRAMGISKSLPNRGRLLAQMPAG